MPRRPLTFPRHTAVDIGNDPPRPAQTLGINLHHVCLRIKDPEKTLKFYRDVLGMRVLFTYNAGSFSIYCERLVPVLACCRAELKTDPPAVADVYHGEEDTEKVWANFGDQKGLVERECPASLLSRLDVRSKLTVLSRRSHSRQSRRHPDSPPATLGLDPRRWTHSTQLTHPSSFLFSRSCSPAAPRH